MTDEIALYIHVPFCQSRCNYCSFVSFANREADIPVYVNALEKELAQRARGQSLSSIFFGGGTPSLLSSDQLGQILITTQKHFDTNKTVEITLEANPGSIDKHFLSAVEQLGINRLSLGVQSMNDETLTLLGRIHTVDQVQQTVQFARNSGFTNLNLDLIYGIPGQALSTWQDTLKRAVHLEAQHLSLYPLTIEDDTPFSKLIQRGKIPSVDPDRTAEQYEAAEDYLASEGYIHYEISNWASEGFQCQHNMVYWQCLPYLGVGVAAHSYNDGHRQANTHDLDEYIRMFQPSAIYQPESDEKITPATQLAEAIIMGLRLTQGIEFANFRDRFGIDLTSRYGQQINELTQLGLIEADNQNIRLTRRGRLLGNEVFWRFLPEREDN